MSERQFTLDTIADLTATRTSTWANAMGGLVVTDREKSTPEDLPTYFGCGYTPLETVIEAATRCQWDGAIVCRLEPRNWLQLHFSSNWRLPVRAWNGSKAIDLSKALPMAGAELIAVACKDGTFKHLSPLATATDGEYTGIGMLEDMRTGSPLMRIVF